MIAYIKGELEYIKDDSIIIDNNGIGLLIKTPTSVINNLPRLHEEVKVHTYMYVREDEMSLYGFNTVSDLEVFKLLINISGIGPKAALAILSTLSVNDLRFAVLGSDSKAISKAPGVGPKSAQRVIIELKDKLDFNDVLSDNELNETKATASNDDNKAEVILALVSLGYSNSEAVKAVSNVDNAKDLDSEQLLKAALKKIMTL